MTATSPSLQAQPTACSPIKGLIGSLHMREPGSRDAGSLCLDTWSRGRAWPYRCSGGHRARLAGEGQIERFSGAWPGACEWELRAESTDARTAHTPRQPINFMLSHATCAQATKQRAFACAGPSSVEPGSVMRAWLAWEDNQSDPKLPAFLCPTR